VSAARLHSFWRRWFGAAGWLVVVAGIVITAAGLVRSLARPDPGVRAHAILSSRLDAMHPDLAGLHAGAEAIEASARDVVGGIHDLDPGLVVHALDEGDGTIPAIEDARGALADTRARLSEEIRADDLPQADRDRLAMLDSAITAAGELVPGWADVVSSASLPVRLMRTLDEHDQTILRAAELGRSASFVEATAEIAEAERLLATARQVREDADQRELDVRTLDELLSRIAAYDSALRRLYGELATSGGEMTDTAQRAADQVEAAEQMLPATTDSMVIITAELGGADATRALGRISQARDAIAPAFDA
jgi:hypothetical protein